ncbi:hypothetical protein [Alkalihalobacterium elongatum]|uniref:hypothetical protein n=1 Tax=Alkalihalobacterium elongatum TaxID=2675466 RepID=UPI001C1FC793|nr:hypothetical protein [Alkalihalobacterium elongatum]
MIKVLKKLVPLVVIMLLVSACGQNETVQTNDQSQAAIKEIQRNEIHISTLSTGEKSFEQNEENLVFTKKQLQNERAWDQTSIEITASKENLLKELDLFYRALEKKELPDYTIDYTFYLHNVLMAYEQREDFNFHYESFMEVVPQRINNIKELKLETKEVDFVRNYYLEAMIVHHGVIKKIGNHTVNIQSENNLLQGRNELQDALLEGYHLLALVAAQLVKIGETTHIIQTEEIDSLKKFISNRIIEEKL